MTRLTHCLAFALAGCVVIRILASIAEPLTPILGVALIVAVIATVYMNWRGTK